MTEPDIDNDDGLEELKEEPKEEITEESKEQIYHDKYIESITHKSEEDEVELDW